MSESDAMQFLMDRVGGLEGVHPSSRMAKLFKQGGPSRTREFRRIHALPRRVWEVDPDIDELVDRLSDYLKTSNGTMKLWPVQAQALREAHDVRGLFGPIAVGKGKALVALLVSLVLKAQRPVLLVPAGLREQTVKFVIPEMRKHWKLHPGLRIISYWELSQDENATILEDLSPDLIIADEVHHLSNLSSGRGKRAKRYMGNNPETIFVALSGTITSRSIKDYAHILWWCLKQGTPLPESWHELSQWADALDELGDEENRSPPGALVIWAQDDEERWLKNEKGERYTPRQGYRDRLTQTHGVVATKETELGVSLQLLCRRLDVPREIGRQLAQLNLTWETPNGELITEAVDLWRHARELCCGFWYRWDPAPPSDWLDARKAWKKYARNTLKFNKRRLDTELQVWNECARKHHRPNAPKLKELDDDATAKQVEGVRVANAVKLVDYEAELATWRARLNPKHCEWCGWLAVKDKFKINTVAEWVDDFAINDATSWLHDVGGIVWTEHSAWGKRLSEISGFPYFGGGKKASGEILECTSPMIASIRAHCEGKNLQHHHHSNLIATPPSSGKTWEQMLARTHREGQKADVVTNEIYMHAVELTASIRKAMSDAKYLEHTLGSRQKLLYADKDFNLR